MMFSILPKTVLVSDCLSTNTIDLEARQSVKVENSSKESQPKILNCTYNFSTLITIKQHNFTTTMCCINDTTYAGSSGILAPIRVPARIASFGLNVVPKKNVSFERAEVVAIITPSSEMPDSYRHELWYQQIDLDEFKNNARNLCRQIRECDALIDQPMLDTRIDIALESENHCARGLEHRISVERQRNKFLAMRAVLKAQQRYDSPDVLAVIASKCTAWAKEVALCTGYQDFYQAYNPALAHLVPSTPSVTFPLSSHKRSRSSSDDELPSNKRQRTLSPIPFLKNSKEVKTSAILLG